MKAFLVELKTLEPVAIISKKGKSKFVDSLPFIPASTILGAIGRKLIQENIKNGTGKCKDVQKPYNPPNCDQCDQKCFYKIISKGELKLTHATRGNWGFDSPGIVNLQSVAKSREKDERRDILLDDFLEWLGWIGEKEFKESISEEFKKSPTSYDGGRFVSEELMSLIRVGISEQTRTSKENLLYGLTAIKPETIFRFMVLAEEGIKKSLNGEMKIGAWKSRGMGLVGTKIVNEVSLEEFVKKREKAISNGFEKIGGILNKKNIGTFVFLNDGFLGLSELKKIVEIKYDKAIKVRRLRRYENGKIILQDVISAGSAGIFSSENPEIASVLAEFEVKLISKPWLDWIFFNHPVHFGGGK